MELKRLNPVKVVLVFGLLLSLNLNAQITRVFETNIGINNWDKKAFEAKEKTSYIAGSSKYCVFQSDDGKIIINKAYSDMGITFEGAIEASFSESLDKLIIWGKADKKAKGLYCIDVKSGTKLWESLTYTNSFNEYSKENIKVIGNYVFIRENQKDQNTPYLAIDINTGKTAWRYSPGKETVEFSKLYNLSKYNILGVIKSKSKSSTLFEIYDLSSGKRLDSLELKGQYLRFYGVESNVLIHHYISTKESYLTDYNLLEKKKIWTTQVGIKTYDYSPDNIDLKIYKNSILFIAQGIEAFDATTGASKFKIKADLAFNNNSQFSPVITENGILVADYIKSTISLYNKDNGNLMWTIDGDGSNAPEVIISDNAAIVQFGGLFYDIVPGNKVYKVSNPKSILSVDLQTGKPLWKTEMKKDFYFISDLGDNVIVVGVKELILLDKKTGAIVKTAKNPFDNSYYYPDKNGKMKDADINYSKGEVYIYDAGIFSKSVF